jgi:hypothetical protein
MGRRTRWEGSEERESSERASLVVTGKNLGPVDGRGHARCGT